MDTVATRRVVTRVMTKYECLLVIFLSENHHNNTVVLGVVVVANESE